MNPLAIYFASGESLYAGVGLLLALIGITPLVKGRWLNRLRMLFVWVALAMIVMACPPLPWWLNAAFVIAFIAWLAASGTRYRKYLPHTSIILALLALLTAILEIPHRFAPSFPTAPHDRLAVIGDSLSAGIGKEIPWPKVLEARTGIPVKNLSIPGAQVSDALDLARRLTPDDSLVLLEIGGNDLIAGTSSADFERHLSALFAACDNPGRTLVMYELPLLPHRIAYGHIQRRLAAQHHVYLIPKRYLTTVISGRDATSDGLHLSPAGADRMATQAAELLAPLLTQKSPSHSLPAPATRPGNADTR